MYSSNLCHLLINTVIMYLYCTLKVFLNICNRKPQKNFCLAWFELFCYKLADTYISSTFVLILDTGSITLQCNILLP